MTYFVNLLYIFSISKLYTDIYYNKKRWGNKVDYYLTVTLLAIFLGLSTL